MPPASRCWGVELEAKRLELLRELVSTSACDRNARKSKQCSSQGSVARRAGGCKRHAPASRDFGRKYRTREVEAAFTTLVQQRAGALLVGADTFFHEPASFIRSANGTPRDTRDLPMGRSHVDAGGLMSYGASLIGWYRQTGAYAGKILKEKSRPTCRSCRRQVRASHQPQDRRKLDLDHSANPARPRRRSDRVEDRSFTAIAQSCKWHSYSCRGLISTRPWGYCGNKSATYAQGGFFAL